MSINNIVTLTYSAGRINAYNGSGTLVGQLNAALITYGYNTAGQIYITDGTELNKLIIDGAVIVTPAFILVPQFLDAAILDSSAQLRSTSVINTDTAGRTRVSQQTTLFDGKTLNQDNTFIFSNAGTGSGAFSNNKFPMSVTAGQYYVRQAKRFSPYFSGKTQFVETTFENFEIDANVVKRAGYFSSNAVAPYDSDKDGCWLESDGVNNKYWLVVSNAGTETYRIDLAFADNAAALTGYDWDNFTVCAFSFLWLGGAALQFYMVIDGAFTLIHTIKHAGNSTGVFMRSPNQPIRYEIRSTTGAGAFTYICSQVSTEGSINEEGYNGAVETGTAAITLAGLGTTYPILGIRKKASNRDVSVKATGVGVFVSSGNDRALWTLQLAPVISGAGLVYGDLANTNIQSAVGNGTLTVATPGKILAGGYITQNSVIAPDQFAADYLTYLGVNIDNTLPDLVLCVTAITAPLDCYGNLNFKENTNQCNSLQTSTLENLRAKTARRFLITWWAMSGT